MEQFDAVQSLARPLEGQEKHEHGNYAVFSQSRRARDYSLVAIFFGTLLASLRQLLSHLPNNLEFGLER